MQRAEQQLWGFAFLKENERELAEVVQAMKPWRGSERVAAEPCQLL